MVQRKCTDKPGIQADLKNYIKLEKRTYTSSENQDIRNKGGGTELKKVMKKLRSLKRLDLENVGSCTPRRKPSVEASAATVTPQKSTPIKILDSLPNYMKSTSSSSARKERLQVSPGISRTNSDSKSLIWKESNYRKPSSANKAVRTLTKMASLKPVRILTKVSSMKAGRPSMKKSSGVSLSANQKLGRATCSSTLKDSKFPSYVMLQPGGTESEGFSVMKVCPYTYCSLNGHHHASLPPLKQFLSSRRRALKAQKSMRLKIAPPVKSKPSGGSKKKVDTDQIVFVKDLASFEADSSGMITFPEVEEVGIDFDAQPREEINPHAVEDNTHTVKDGGETSVENDGGRHAEGFSDELSQAKIFFEGLEQTIDFSGAEMENTTAAFPEKIQQELIEDRDPFPFFIVNEIDLQGCWGGSESESESSAESEIDESDYEATDMDWEEGRDEDPCLDNTADLSTLASGENDEAFICLQGYGNFASTEEIVSIPEYTVNNFHEELLAIEEELPAEYEDYVESSDTDSGTSKLKDGGQSLEIDLLSKDNSEILNILNKSLKNLHSLMEDAFMEPQATNEGKDEPDVSINREGSSAFVEFSLQEPTVAHQEDYEVSGPDNSFFQGPVLLNDENGALIEEEEVHSLEVEFGLVQGITAQDQNIDEQERCQLHEPEHESQAIEVADPETYHDVFIDELDKMHMVQNAYADDEAKEKGHTYKNKPEPSGEINEKNETMQVKQKEDAEETSLPATESKSPDEKIMITTTGSDNDEQMPKNCNNFKRNGKKPISDCEEQREFNPREPHYLPVEPDPEAEKVDLRHQMMDDRKDSEEWMLDYAVRQAVTKLGPARKRKVELLVEAFETVIPISKYGNHLQHNPTAFAHSRLMQACS
ncbi:hypothetical protein GIB67_011662 [Kingdonia uniflora]|uniref:Calmodulin-binding domain-containing protein n=1 Tax=Kingdonia uniflora TaxID=39325 RepID=A0A7J7N9R3_9MAGN|nr:hypothetical protein GIB67_011662 [Kingdonia uniflora]